MWSPHLSGIMKASLDVPTWGRQAVTNTTVVTPNSWGPSTPGSNGALGKAAGGQGNQPGHASVESLEPS